MLNNILYRFSDGWDIVTLGQVTPTLSVLSEDRQLWKRLCQYHFAEQQVSVVALGPQQSVTWRGAGMRPSPISSDHIWLSQPPWPRPTPVDPALGTSLKHICVRPAGRSRVLTPPAGLCESHTHVWGICSAQGSRAQVEEPDAAHPVRDGFGCSWDRRVGGQNCGCMAQGRLSLLVEWGWVGVSE